MIILYFVLRVPHTDETIFYDRVVTKNEITIMMGKKNKIKKIIVGLLHGSGRTRERLKCRRAACVRLIIWRLAHATRRAAAAAADRRKPNRLRAYRKSWGGGGRRRRYTASHTLPRKSAFVRYRRACNYRRCFRTFAEYNVFRAISRAREIVVFSFRYFSTFLFFIFFHGNDYKTSFLILCRCHVGFLRTRLEKKNKNT